MKYFSTKRKILNILGILFILMPVWLMLCVFAVGGVYDAIDEWKYQQFNRHLARIIEKQAPVIPASRIGLPPFVDFEWKRVCVSNFYCGAANCDPYLWQLIFENDPGYKSYPVDVVKFGNFYKPNARVTPYCVDKESAFFIMDEKGLRLVNRNALSEE